MLQGLRRKIGRYAPRAGGAKEPEEEEQVQLKENATPFETAAWHFSRQDRVLRRLETETTLMIDQIQVACATMATVADIFCSGGDEAVGGCIGGEYKSAMKQIEREEAERMEQSIRFTVLDPLQARLELHGQIREDINARDKLEVESKMLRGVTLRMQSSGLEDDDRRAQTELDLHRVAAALQQAEAQLLPQLEDTIQSGAASIVALFNATRLQTAIFFRNANQALRSSLSPAEHELISEANQPLKVLAIVKHTPCSVSLSASASKLSKASSLTSDGWTEVDGSNSSTAPDGVDTISGSDEDDELNTLPITIEDFEAGRVPQVCNAPKGGAKAQTADSSGGNTEIVTLASYPVVTHDDDGDVQEKRVEEEQSSRVRRSTSPSPRTASFKPITPRRTASMFWSIRKTIRGKLSYATGETRMIRQSSAPVIDTSGVASEDGANSLAKNGEQLHIIPQSATEWLAIEECLWEIDLREAKSPGKSLLTADSISSTADVLLSGLLQKHDALYFECLSYLRVEDLARLSKVNFRLRSHLLDSAPIWKKCIRSGGLSPAIRSSLWLSVFYESTPWRSSGIASHYLSPDRRHSMYDQLLTKVEVKLADGLIAEGLPLSDDDSQLAVWFREIDVDVVRTCHRSIHDGNVETVSSLSPPISSTEMSNDKDSVESVMMELIDCIVRNEGSESSFDSTENSELEAKIRRVLRAYVLYNPRVGYCQGMGFLVRLLAEVANDEADIFWLFVGFSEPENDRNLYEPGMAVLQPYLSKFELLFSTHMPELYTHLQAEGVHVATFCTRWFLTFFSSFETLAPTLVTRLLDIFVIDGWRIMFSVSLVILDELKEQLLQSDMEGILRVLQFPRRYMPEPDQLRKRQLVRHALAFSISRAINSI
ncbi:Ecotropic viral integration site 5 protein-like protein [Phytophthora ramorum]|uniref:Ecotropic viral integration site 5 protein-like protein n=1 Tax=Phytophthora ramorum TaxID=164328 RepID=UPI0030A30EB5|nr:Ecotropic viral integration site 5 protein-like protein [Phytophthora ramorum]